MFAIISFDESEVRALIDFDENVGRLMKAGKCLCVEVKGLTGKFKQVVYVDFVPVKSDDKNAEKSEEGAFNKEILLQIIDKLREVSGITVIGTTCDNGSSNVKLWKNLNVDEDETYFTHKGRRIYCFSDHSHCVKLIRNHFVEKMFIRHKKNDDGSESQIEFYPREYLLPISELATVDLLMKHLDVGNNKQHVVTALKVINHESKSIRIIRTLNF